MPKLSYQATEQRQRHILNAAMRCFSHLGYHATTMRHILAEAQLSAGAVYNYYPSKEAILQAIAERDLQRSQQAIEQLAQHSNNAIDALVGILLADLKRIELLGQAKMKVCIAAEQATNGDLQAALAPLQQAQIAAVDQLLKQPRATAPSQVLFMLYFGAVQALAIGQPIDYQVLQQQLLQLLNG
ncbi:MAG: putative HTH-type transcriptional regulator YfiR [Pseudidiomarina mangrovi]|nr:MAG: putative HTH-type transcriptional regulator YfiR [Pseudidiomarina mangrovi]